jgi:hypothetical protein
MQQQIWRGLQCVCRRVQEWSVGRCPQVQVRGRLLKEGGALFGLPVCRMDRQRMLNVKICRATVAAVAHKLLWALVDRVEGTAAAMLRQA